MEYKLRTCYVNCAEHLLNSQNVNILFDDAGGKWTESQWLSFFKEIQAFGFNNFQIWIPPTLCAKGERRERSAKYLNKILDLCHKCGLTFNVLLAANTIGSKWYFACPNCEKERADILEFWRFWAENLSAADIYTIFPGDPGGCNRNGCNHITFIELAAEIANMLKSVRSGITVEIGTWGTPFTGWGDDMRPTPEWDGTFAMLTDPETNNPEIPCHIWNGSEERAEKAMGDLLSRLHLFPKDTMFSISAGFNPDCEPIGKFDGRPWAKIISKTHRVNSWDYSASEGELVCYPHHRVAKYLRKRRLETDGITYNGAICYTMTPKLSQLMLYSAAQILKDTTRKARDVASEFSSLVFGDEKIGLLMEAFEIVPAWGYEPIEDRSKSELKAMLEELKSRLEACKGYESRLPIFPSAEEYRQELLWHAQNFIQMLGENSEREKIKEDYRQHMLSIYDKAPSAVDERTVLSSMGYSNIGNENYKRTTNL